MKNQRKSRFQSSVSFEESFEHRRNFVLVGEVVFNDDPGCQALEGGELEGVDFAIRNHLQEVDRTLEQGVASVDVGAIFKQNFDNLKLKKNLYLKLYLIDGSMITLHSNLKQG